MLKKVDVKKTYYELFHAQQHEFSFITVPYLQYITIDTALEDIGSALMLLEALKEKLIHVAAELRGIEYIPSYLEGRCGADSDIWSMMILQPSWIDREFFERSLEALQNDEIDPKGLSFQVIHEGLSVQTLHTGSWDEIPAIRNFLADEWIPQQGYIPGDKHHEIYITQDLPRHPAEASQYIIRREVIKEEP